MDILEFQLPWAVKELSDDFFLKTNHKYMIVSADGRIVAKVEGWGAVPQATAEKIVEAVNASATSSSVAVWTPDFSTQLRSLLNCFSKENGSDTPDFILAKYLEGCLNLWNSAMREREDWYGRKAQSVPGPVSVDHEHPRPS